MMPTPTTPTFMTLPPSCRSRRAQGLDAGEHAADRPPHQGGEILGDAAVIDVFADGVIEDAAMHHPDMLELGFADRHLGSGRQAAIMADLGADRLQQLLLDDPDVAAVDV